MDDISSARDYFIEGKEIVIAKNKDDWFDKIKYYYDNPKEARLIAQAGQLRAQKDHTYHNRVDMIINLLR
jgi:spore maturation protein CgeB